MKRIFLITVCIFLTTAASFAGARPDGKNAIYFAQTLTGGTSDALDALDITAASTPNAYDLADGDGAFVLELTGVEGRYSVHIFDADGTDAESKPDVIRPDDYSASGVWRLVGSIKKSILLSVLTETPSHTEGLLFYVSGEYGPSFYNADADIRLNIGFENWKIVRNDTGADIPDSSAVYISGSTGQIPTIALAQANAAATSNVVGLTTHIIENNTIGVITTFGVVNEDDTSAFDDGDTIYLSATEAGGKTKVEPQAPNYAIQLGHIDYSHSEHGKFEVQIEYLVNQAPYSSSWDGFKQAVAADAIYDKIESITLCPFSGFLVSPLDASDHFWRRIDRATTVTDIHCIVTGTGTITLTVQECDSAGANCSDTENAITCDSDGAEDDGTLSDASWDVGDWIKIIYGAPAGTVDAVSWSVLIE